MSLKVTRHHDIGTRPEEVEEDVMTKIGQENQQYVSNIMR
jgi:hypothetical protein